MQVLFYFVSVQIAAITFTTHSLQTLLLFLFNSLQLNLQLLQKVKLLQRALAEMKYNISRLLLSRKSWQNQLNCERNCAFFFSFLTWPFSRNVYQCARIMRTFWLCICCVYVHCIFEAKKVMSMWWQWQSIFCHFHLAFHPVFVASIWIYYCKLENPHKPHFICIKSKPN